MFIQKTPQKSGLDEAIDSVLEEMKNVESDSQEYDRMSTQLERLYKLKEIDAPKRVSPDTVLLVAGNLLGIVAIVGFERANVVTSKALSLLLKLR